MSWVRHFHKDRVITQVSECVAVTKVVRCVEGGFPITSMFARTADEIATPHLRHHHVFSGQLREFWDFLYPPAVSDSDSGRLLQGIVARLHAAGISSLHQLSITLLFRVHLY